MINLSKIGENGIAYDGVTLSDYFIIRGVDMPMLPTIETTSLNIDGKPGAWFTSRQIGTRDIILRLAILADSKNRVDIMDEWLRFSHLITKGEEKQLDLGNGYYVNAVMTGTSNITRNMRWSTVDVTFRCFDPFIYGDTHVEQLSAGDNDVYIQGDYPAFPVYTINGAEESFTLKNNDTGKVVTVHGLASDTKLTIDMAKYRCTVRDRYYQPADPSVSDFWPLEPGANSINLSSGYGELVYTERYL